MTWQFKISKQLSFCDNIKAFLSLLKLKNLELITKNSFKPPKGQNNFTRIFRISSVRMVGDVAYLKQNLQSSIRNVEKYVESYMASDESFLSKRYELERARLFIKEYLFTNNLMDAELLDIVTTTTFPLHTSDFSKSIAIRFNQCNFSEIAQKEVGQHLSVRKTYVSHLDALLDLENQKLNFSEIEKASIDRSRNAKKEIQLLETWIALNHAGFLDGLSDDKKSIQRKKYFECFGLTDWKYPDRHADFKNRKLHKAIFLKEMVDQLDQYE